MPSAPASPDVFATIRTTFKTSVRLKEDGSAPEPGDEVTWLIPLEIVRTAGSRPDYAVFEVDMAAAGVRLVDRQAFLEYNAQVEVWQLDDEEEPVSPIFWGELLAQEFAIDEQERLIATARIDDYHFGNVLQGEYQYNPDFVQGFVFEEPYELVSKDVEFNPLIDGLIEPNAVITVNPLYWLDPESARFLKSQLLHLGAPQLWNLRTAIRALLNNVNPDETFISNPELEQDDTRFDDLPAFENVTLRRGSYLPQYLDALLHPYGFDWHVGIGQDSAGATTRSIEIFRRGEGTEKSVYLQSPGETLDLSKTNTNRFRVETDIGELANKVICEGSRQEAQLTLPLYRAWAEADDSLTAEDLRRSDETSQYEDKQLVWRKFVANEAGDYTDSRTEITDHPALTLVFDDPVIPRRRPMVDCLTTDDDEQRRPPYLEWSSDGGSTFKEVPPEWGWVLSRRECAIYFTGDTPPTELMDAGSNAKLQITGTIQGDARVAATKTPSDLTEEIVSPNTQTTTLYLDVSDRFHKREIVNSGTFASSLSGGGDTVDDSTEIATYAEDVLRTELSATVRCDFELHGLIYFYEIGDLIKSVDGRNIDLDRNHKDSEVRRYLQVTGIRHDVQGQRTVLTVEPTEDR